MDRVGAFLRERTPRRAIALVVFLALLVLFRKLLVLLVFFVAFERIFGASSAFVARRTGMRRKAALLALVALVLAAAGAGTWLGASGLVRWIAHVRETFPERVAAVREWPLYAAVREHLADSDRLVEGARHYAAGAVQYLAALGHALVYLVIGFILAVVYVLEEEEIEAFRRSLDPRSLRGTLVRWLGDVADAVVVTLQLQVIVAACNAALTLPVLYLIGVPHKALLMFFIFATGLVPVVGNFVSGVVLSVLAWQTKGWLGVGLFVGLTAVLHKIESYYLNPRLTARHVRLPGFVLILGILAWEHLLGFVGLFVSFPFLFVAGRIRAEWREEDEQDAATSASRDPPSGAPGSGAASRAPPAFGSQ